MFIYKYLKFNCYRIHKGSKFYKGKIIYEGEQKLKNDADLGNMISNVRKSKVMVQSLLDRDTYTYLKYQQCKFIDVVETPNAKYTDLNSQCNNVPSIDDARDYIQLPFDSARESVTAKGKGKGGKTPTPDLFSVGAAQGIEMRMTQGLTQGVIKEATTNALSVNQVRNGTVDETKAE